MLHHINGTLFECGANYAVVDCGGVGYYLTVSGNTTSKLSGKNGEKVMLYCFLKVSEDAVDLYGFATEEELSIFKMLITVSGVGAKSAIAVLTHLTPEKFAIAVSMQDAKAISKAPGVGGKTAARIILELKDKVAKNIALGQDEPLAEETSSGDGGKLGDALDTLLVLGYSRREATGALSGIDLNALSLEDIVRAALKKLVRN